MRPVMLRSNFSTKKRLLPTERRWKVRVTRSVSEKVLGSTSGRVTNGREVSVYTCWGMLV